jgi:nucleotide-binding universal stress UspA family protein
MRMDSAQAYVNQVVGRARLGGATISGAAVEDTAGVAETLLDVVKQRGASLIAMATHGRGGVGRVVLGSVTDKVVRAADVPVLVVPLSPAARDVIKVQEQMSQRLLIEA